VRAVVLIKIDVHGLWSSVTKIDSLSLVNAIAEVPAPVADI